ncbi:Quinolinate phosphoribosyl transferase [Dipodascopsis tothii]|uniref:Quinolinate phosphoribosyl transferase n=1 Tax=Dipodascopsis tothii TaxID=44089 RepID=UPI0034CF851A
MPAIPSLLDTDLYKLTMQAAVLEHFPAVPVTYQLKNRTPQKKLTPAAFEWLAAEIAALGELAFSEAEIDYLRTSVPQLPLAYLDYVKTFRLRPAEQIKLAYDDAAQDFSIEIGGLWVETILYEIPILALVSEAYFRFVDTDWDTAGQVELAERKCLDLLAAGCSFSEFGTRRRRSFAVQELVMRGLVAGHEQFVAAHGGSTAVGLRGTSNVHFARQFGLVPIGTVAHEWMMGIAAVTGDYDHPNATAMTKWRETIGDKYVGVALTDTFGTDAFLRDFTHPLVDIFAGVRQDSGDPLVFVDKIAAHYDALGVDKSTKAIVFSDSLDVEACKRYKAATDAKGMIASFGVGTFLTNDFRVKSSPKDKSTPLNIVIKIATAGGNPAVKISDNMAKNTGDQATVDRVKVQLGYVERTWTDGDEATRWDAPETK